MSDVACTGSEATIFDCSFSSTTGCSHGEDVGVECKLIENITFFLSLLQTLLLQTPMYLNNPAEKNQTFPEITSLTGLKTYNTTN